MTIGARKIEVPHIQRNATLGQLPVLLPTGKSSTGSRFMGINRGWEALGISPSCPLVAPSIPHRFPPVVNDISMDYTESIILLVGVSRLGKGIEIDRVAFAALR